MTDRSPLRAFAILGTSSVAALAGGLVTAKVTALVLGPAGVGTLALLQTVLGFAIIVGGVGQSTALLRTGSSAIAASQMEVLGRTWKTVWTIYWLATIPVAALVLLFREPIALLLGGDGRRAGAVAWMAPALALAVGASLYQSLANSHGDISAIARLGIWLAVAQNSAVVLVIIAVGRGGEAIALCAGAGAALIVGRSFTSFHNPVSPPAAAGRPGETRSMLRFGMAHAASSLASNGALLLVPVLVVHRLDESSAGLARAATTLTSAYVSFILLGFTQHYFPRLSATRDRQVLERLVNDQLRAIALVGIPLVFLGIASSPILVPILFSRQFLPAVAILDWQFAGDLFKFVSWAFTFALLAAGRTGWFFISEAIGGVLLSGLSFVGLERFGIEGVGIAYLATYVLYAGITILIGRRALGLSLAVANVRVFGAAAVGAAIALTLLASGMSTAGRIVALIIGLLAVTPALHQVSIAQKRRQGRPGDR